MTLEDFCKGIQVHGDIKNIICRDILPEDIFQKYNYLLKSDKQRFIYELNKEKNTKRIALIFYVKKAIELYEEFQKKNISEDIYFDTFYDITLWSNIYYDKDGGFGLDWLDWFILHIEMKLFRLGRLQFETTVLKEDIRIDDLYYKKGTDVLSVHIPEGESLNIDSCKNSFRKAKEFFGSKYNMFFCESWLLSPNLKNILSEESNIIKFQNKFRVYNTIYSYRQAEERIFGEILEDKEMYSEKTSLQKKAKEYLRLHDDLGIGLGVLKYDDL